MYTERVLDYWYKKTYSSQTLGTKSTLGGAFRQPYVDDWVWDPMDTLRPINPPCPRSMSALHTVPLGNPRTAFTSHRPITPVTFKNGSRLLIGVLDDTGEDQKDLAALVWTDVRHHPMRKGDGDVIILLGQETFYQLCLKIGK